MRPYNCVCGCVMLLCISRLMPIAQIYDIHHLLKKIMIWLLSYHIQIFSEFLTLSCIWKKTHSLYFLICYIHWPSCIYARVNSYLYMCFIEEFSEGLTKHWPNIITHVVEQKRMAKMQLCSLTLGSKWLVVITTGTY